MKLIHYTLRNLFVPILVIFAAWGCVFCLMILHEVEDETNDSLENYKEIIIRSALADSTLLKDHVDIMTRYYIREVPESEAKLVLRYYGIHRDRARIRTGSCLTHLFHDKRS